MGLCNELNTIRLQKNSAHENFTSAKQETLKIIRFNIREFKKFQDVISFKIHDSKSSQVNTNRENLQKCKNSCY